MLGDTTLSEVITGTVTHQLLSVDSSRRVWAPAPDGRERMGNQNFYLQTFEYETSAVGIEDQSLTIYRKQFMYALNRTKCLFSPVWGNISWCATHIDTIPCFPASPFQICLELLLSRQG